MVSLLDLRPGSRWFEPSPRHRVVSLDKKLQSTLCLFTQVYKWVPVIIMLGGNLVMDWHPIQGETATLNYKNKKKQKQKQKQNTQVDPYFLLCR